MTQTYNISQIDKATTSPSTDIDKLTDAHDAHRSNFSGTSDPTIAIPYQIYADTTNEVYKQRNSGDTAWNIISSATGTPVISKSANYTAALSDYAGLILVDASSAAVTITLPSSSVTGNGWNVVVKKTDSSTNAVTIASSDNIDGVASVEIANQNKVIGVRTNGTTYSIYNSDTALASTGSGNLVLLEKYTVTGATEVPIVGHVTSLYKNYVLRYDLTFSSSQNNLTLLLSADNGTTYLATGYTYVFQKIDSSDSDDLIVATNTSSFNILSNINGTTSDAAFAELRFHHMLETHKTMFQSQANHTVFGNQFENQSGGGRLEDGTITDALKLKTTGSTTLSGVIDFFGVVK